MSNELLFIIIAISCVGVCLLAIVFIFWQQIQQSALRQTLEQRFAQIQENLLEKVHLQAKNSHEYQLQHLTTIQTTLRETLGYQTEKLTTRIEQLTQIADNKLQQISTKVTEKLNEGFEKTAETFTNIVKRLALIDDAQKKITELSSNVVSLQQILADKRSRGAFGEIQLKNLIENMLPSENVSFQHTLSNGLRCDCLLLLPKPTDNIVIDAKFPLENYYKLADIDSSEIERQKASQQFRQDIKKHIQDIAQKYIIPGETADGAIMFLPSEAIFAEIHSHFPELVNFAQQQRVWLVSPTTMMAILTTASAVLKDTATREHVHIIQVHLRYLAKDFARFDDRMQKLARHIDMAHDDVQQVHTSAQKISKRFQRIEQADLTELQPELIDKTPEKLLE